MIYRLLSILFGILLLYISINSIISEQASGIGLVGFRPINPHDDTIEYWFVILMELYLAYAALRYAITGEAQDE